MIFSLYKKLNNSIKHGKFGRMYIITDFEFDGIFLSSNICKYNQYTVIQIMNVNAPEDLIFKIKVSKFE